MWTCHYFYTCWLSPLPAPNSISYKDLWKCPIEGTVEVHEAMNYSSTLLQRGLWSPEFCTFSNGSISFLRVLRKVSKYYYKSDNSNSTGNKGLFTEIHNALLTILFLIYCFLVLKIMGWCLFSVLVVGMFKSFWTFVNKFYFPAGLI